MKRTFLALVISLFSLSAFSVVSVVAPDPTPGPVKASSIMLPIGTEGKKISLEQLAHMKPREFAQMSGKHMGFLDRVGFSIAQKKLRNSINADGTVNNKHLLAMAPEMDGETGFHIGGFALGFFLGLIGVLIAYIINDDKSSNRRKWAWLGLGIFLVIYIALIIAVLA